MIQFTEGKALNRYVQELKKKGLSLGWVPTMGALHEGHISLVREARRSSRFTMVSIFINPTQFNDKKDFDKYPVTRAADIALLEQNGADLLYLPTVEDIYPLGLGDLEEYNLGRLEEVFEGKYRPGHFQGVCQVMNRLRIFLDPDHLYMGQKDYQQCLVVQKLLHLLHSPLTLHTCPTTREPDGLAMSSRNVRLSETGRKNAPAIYRALTHMKENLRPGALGSLERAARQILEKNEFRTDYAAFAHAGTLEPREKWDGQEPLVALVAAVQQDVRLIDNLLMPHPAAKQ